MRQIPRLFVDDLLAEGAVIDLSPGHAHQLATVLRLAAGAALRLCDDRTGEWAAVIAEAGRRRVTVRVGAMIRGRETVADCWLLAAPLRPERFAWVVEKATELGVARIVPVLTERVNHARQKRERLLAHMVEAAEQCGRTALPELAAPVHLAELLGGWDDRRALLFADEEGGAPMPAVAPPLALLIGPEGGFSGAERAMIAARPAALRVSLGPRILRADTAAVAAIAQWQRLSAPVTPPLAPGGDGR